jgi:alpha-glucosidase
VTPWLPLGEPATGSVDRQREDPGSILTLTRDLITLRKQTPDLCAGSYTTLPAPDGVWAWRRGSRFVVVVNLTASDATLSNIAGRVRIATDRARDGQTISGPLTLRDWEGLVIET